MIDDIYFSFPSLPPPQTAYAVILPSEITSDMKVADCYSTFTPETKGYRQQYISNYVPQLHVISLLITQTNRMLIVLALAVWETGLDAH